MKLSVPIFKLKRQAKILSRENNIPLHKALNIIAKKNGFSQWSALSTFEHKQQPAQKISRQLEDGDLMLLAARPGHGKTVLAIQLLLDAIDSGKYGIFFSLEYTALDIWSQIKSLGKDPDKYSDKLSVDTSDDICANYISKFLKQTKEHSFVVVDYMQLLDQKRQNAALELQIEELSNIARIKHSVIVMLSQIHRSFDLSTRAIPNLEDIRLPNQVNLNYFSKTCFMHDGQLEFSDAK